MKDKKGINGWLIPVVLVCIFSALSNTYRLIQRIIAISTQNPALGVYVSMALLVIYCILIWMVIIFIFMKKKAAIKSFIAAAISGTIFSFWFYLLSQLIYTPASSIVGGLLAFLLNLIIVALILVYLLKSKRVKKTLAN